MVTDKMIAVIRAFQDGKKIQFRELDFDKEGIGSWGDIDAPGFDFVNFEYREKPTTVPVPEPEAVNPALKMYQYVCIAEDGSLFVHKQLASEHWGKKPDMMFGYRVHSRVEPHACEINPEGYAV